MARRRHRPRRPRYSTSLHPPRFMMRHRRPVIFVWAMPSHFADRSCNQVIGPPITEVKPYLYVVQEDDTDGAGSIPEKFGLEPVAGYAELRRANADANFSTDEHGTCSFQSWYAGRKVRIPAHWPEPGPGIQDCCLVPYPDGQVGFTRIEKEIEEGPRSIVSARGPREVIETEIDPGSYGILPARKLPPDGDVGFTLIEKRTGVPPAPEPTMPTEPDRWGSQNLNEWKAGVTQRALQSFTGPYPETVVDPSLVEQFLLTWPSSQRLQSFIVHHASQKGLQSGLYSTAAWMYLLWRHGIEVQR